MVTATMIIELMGRPADHAAEALEKYMKNLDDIKHVEIIKKEFSTPKKVDDEKDLYTCFCEVEFRCETMQQLIHIVFDFMPSSVEVVDPATVSMDVTEATDMLNALSGRLHRYDDVVKIVQNREKKMMQEIKIAKHLLQKHNLIDKKGNIIDKDNSSKEEEKEESKD